MLILLFSVSSISSLAIGLNNNVWVWRLSIKLHVDIERWRIEVVLEVPSSPPAPCPVFVSVNRFINGAGFEEYDNNGDASGDMRCDAIGSAARDDDKWAKYGEFDDCNGLLLLLLTTSVVSFGR